MLTCVAALAVLMPPDAVADLLDSLEIQLPHFQTSFEVETYFMRTDADVVWEDHAPDRTETIDLLVSGGMVRSELSSNEGDWDMTWDGATNATRVMDGARPQIIYRSELRLPADSGTNETLRFNQITSRFPVRGRVADGVRIREVLDQTIENGILTHRMVFRGPRVCQIDSLVIQMEPETRLLRWGTVMGRTTDPAAVREHLTMEVVTEYSQWQTHGDITLPGLVTRDGMSTREEPGSGETVTHRGRTAFRRTGFVDRSDDPPPAEAFTIPLEPGASVNDDVRLLSFHVGGRELSYHGVHLMFDDPIAEIPDTLGGIAVRGEVFMGRGVEPFGRNPSFSLSPTGGQGDPFRAGLTRLEGSRPEIALEGSLEDLQRAVATRTAWHAQRAAMIGSLLAIEPAAPELPELLPYRWKYADLVPGVDLAAELKGLARTHPDASAALTAGAYWSAAHRIVATEPDPARRERAADLFIARHPDDPRGTRLLTLCWFVATDPVVREQLQRRIAAEYGDTFEGMSLRAELREKEAVGELVEFAFLDLATGQRIEMADLRGKVVAINFWATWCGPCVNSMPSYLKHYENLKKRYGDRFEMIGVSLDADPETALAFCRQNQIPWPQLCEPGRTWNTSVARTFGVNGVPRTIIVGGDGQVRNTRARASNYLYQDVERIIKREQAERKAREAGAAP